MNRANRRVATIKSTLALLILLLVITHSIAWAEDGQRNCSLEVSLMAERVKDENPEEDWSFVILTGSGDEKTYNRVEVSPQETSSQNSDEEIHISSTDELVEGEFYKIYSADYTAKEEVFVGLQTVSNGEEKIQASGFNSTVFNLNCEDMFMGDNEDVVVSTLGENEFKVTATKNAGQKSESETVWNVSTFVAYHGQHEPRFQLADLARPLSILLWLGWSWHVLF
ncbi:hypothetical protein KGY79_08555 [Candidatus Bipolaricaulota bacterium]|nr:hypothetical protein [Candidatus Bipolaricaulota bacterium]